MNMWDYSCGGMSFVGNQVMMLEHGERGEMHNGKTTATTIQKVSGKRDPLRGVEQPKPVEIYNKYHLLIEDDSDDSEDNESFDRSNSHTRPRKAYNPNKRQPRKTTIQRACERGDGELRDVVAAEGYTEADWGALGPLTTDDTDSDRQQCESCEVCEYDNSDIRNSITIVTHNYTTHSSRWCL